MITDAQLRCSNNQSLTGAAATTTSTNTIDLLSANTNMGIGDRRRARVQVGTAFTGGTSVQALYVQSANADLSSSDTLATGEVIADADAVAGKVLMDIIAPSNTKRYVGFKYVTVVGAGTHTTGTIGFAGIVADTDQQPYLPANLGR